MWRKSLIFLSAWIKKPNRKPLIIRGARQVGKSTLVKLFAEENKIPLHTINLELPTSLIQDIKQLNIQQLITSLELTFDLDLTGKHPSKCLLFFDESQAVPELLKLLRYFYEEYPHIAVITAGSLLEFELSEPAYAFPVGRVEFLHLGPMDFEEYLLACGEKRLYDYIVSFSLDQKINSTAHQKLTKLSKDYMLTGGMPEAVYIRSTQGLKASLETKQQLLTAYQLDFNKYKGRTYPERLSTLLHSIPTKIGTKTKYNQLLQDLPAKDVKKSLLQLKMAGIVHFVCHSDANGLPLGAEKKAQHFKLLFIDIGLMITQLGIDVAQLQNENDLNLINDGQLAEQFIGQQLLYLNHSTLTPELFYWIRQGRSNAELDYVFASHNKIVPIEVKSGKAGTLRSMHQFINEKKSNLGIRFLNNEPIIENINTKIPNGEVNYTLISLPHYLVGQVNRLLTDY